VVIPYVSHHVEVDAKGRVEERRVQKAIRGRHRHDEEEASGHDGQHGRPWRRGGANGP
jgi:hypothetical protein